MNEKTSVELVRSVLVEMLTEAERKRDLVLFVAASRELRQFDLDVAAAEMAS